MKLLELRKQEYIIYVELFSKYECSHLAVILRYHHFRLQIHPGYDHCPSDHRAEKGVKQDRA